MHVVHSLHEAQRRPLQGGDGCMMGAYLARAIFCSMPSALPASLPAVMQDVVARCDGWPECQAIAYHARVGPAWGNYTPSLLKGTGDGSPVNPKLGNLNPRWVGMREWVLFCVRVCACA